VTLRAGLLASAAMGRTRGRPAASGPPLAAWHGADATRVAALVELGLGLSSTLDLDALLDLAVDRAARLLAADGATLFLVDPRTGELLSKVVRGGAVREIRLAAGRGLAGWVARTGRPVSVPDAYADGRFDPSVDRRTGFQTRSVACAPLPDRAGRVIGVLEAVDRRAAAFGEEEERLLGAVASQAAVALENARFLSEAAERNRALAAARGELERRVAELDLLLGLERRLAGAWRWSGRASGSGARIGSPPSGSSSPASSTTSATRSPPSRATRSSWPWSPTRRR
jgi:GAF domain-containing protein